MNIINLHCNRYFVFASINSLSSLLYQKDFVHKWDGNLTISFHLLMAK